MTVLQTFRAFKILGKHPEYHLKTIARLYYSICLTMCGKFKLFICECDCAYSQNSQILLTTEIQSFTVVVYITIAEEGTAIRQ